MSYILDALRKSEQERQAGGVPGLTTPQPTGLPAPSRAGHWKIAVALLMAINAGALGWWLTRPGAAPTPLVAAPAETQPPPPIAPAPSRPEPAKLPSPDLPAPGEAAAARLAPLIEKPLRAPSEPTEKPPRPALPPEDTPPPRSGIIPYADLPPAIKKALPPLNIGGYAEAGGSEIMLLVDDRLVREGEEISGVRVVKIAPEGTVFSYRNYRFRR